MNPRIYVGLSEPLSGIYPEHTEGSTQAMARVRYPGDINADSSGVYLLDDELHIEEEELQFLFKRSGFGGHPTVFFFPYLAQLPDCHCIKGICFDKQEHV